LGGKGVGSGSGSGSDDGGIVASGSNSAEVGSSDIKVDAEIAQAKVELAAHRHTNAALEGELRSETERADAKHAELQIIRAEIKTQQRSETHLRLKIKEKKAELLDVLAGYLPLCPQCSDFAALVRSRPREGCLFRPIHRGA
jgi:chromosome segregation ATPase